LFSATASSSSNTTAAFRIISLRLRCLLYHPLCFLHPTSLLSVLPSPPVISESIRQRHIP
jgi:hypothetical protein